MDIKVQNLTKKFNNYLAVNNISFTLEKGKTLGLLGPKWLWENNFYRNDAWPNYPYKRRSVN